MWESNLSHITLPTMFSKAFFSWGVKKSGLCGNGLKDPSKKALENMVEKGENAGCQHFLLFPQCFLPNQRQSEYSKISFLVRTCFQNEPSKMFFFSTGLSASRLSISPTIKFRLFHTESM